MKKEISNLAVLQEVWLSVYQLSLFLDISQAEDPARHVHKRQLKVLVTLGLIYLDEEKHLQLTDTGKGLAQWYADKFRPLLLRWPEVPTTSGESPSPEKG